MIWIAIALVLLATVVAIAIPVLNAKPPRSATEEYDLAVFTDQMKELERDQARGLINAEEFKAARTEIGRRILAAQRAQDDKTAQKATGSRGNMIAAATVLLLIPLIAAPLYVWRGNPTLIGDRVTAQQPVPTTRPDPAQQAGLTESVKRLQERLEAAPDDFDGWVLLGRSYMVTQQPVLAIEAYAKAVTLRPEDAAVQSYLGEAIVFSADGTVTEKARAAFVKAVEADPTDPAARFYLAMADAQAGNLRKALDAWIALAADTPADAPWRPVLNQQLRVAAQELNVDLAAVLPDAPPPLPPTSGRGGPSREDIEAAEEMSPADRQEMIRGMVAQLAARLEENPDDVEGWRRLARSREVLGENEGAAEAYTRALELEPADPETLLRSAVAAGQLGDAETARARLLRLRDGLPPESGIYSMVSTAIEFIEADPEQVAEITRNLGDNPTGAAPAASAPAGPAPAAPAARGPGADDIAAAQQMSNEERAEMIRGMVAGLAARLEENPDDVEGWRRLARSREVLGESEAAAEAYTRALELDPDHPETLLRGAIAAGQLGERDVARARFVRLRDLIPAESEIRGMIDEAIRRIDDASSK